MSLLLRTVLTLQRAGIERCTVVGALALPRDPRIRCDLTTSPTFEPAADPAPRLVVGAGAVVDEALVRDLQRRVATDGSVRFENAGAEVWVAPGGRVPPPNGHAPGRPRTGTLAPAGGPAGAVEHALLRGLENPRDGYVDRLLYRRLSRPLTRLVLRTPLTPNAITVIGVLFGIAGGLALGSAGEVGVFAGVLALVLSGVLDCVDGELARLRFTESKLGHVLDIVGDTVVHAALFAGIVWYLTATGATPGRTELVVLGVGILGAFGAITACEVMETRRRRDSGWENRIIDGVLSPLTTRDWYVFPVAFAVLGWLPRLVPAAAVGANVFWMGALVLLARVLRRTRAGGPPSTPPPGSQVF